MVKRFHGIRRKGIIVHQGSFATRFEPVEIHHEHHNMLVDRIGLRTRTNTPRHDHIHTMSFSQYGTKCLVFPQQSGAHCLGCAMFISDKPNTPLTRLSPGTWCIYGPLFYLFSFILPESLYLGKTRSSSSFSLERYFHETNLTLDLESCRYSSDGVLFKYEVYTFIFAILIEPLAKNRNLKDNFIAFRRDRHRFDLKTNGGERLVSSTPPGALLFR